MHLAHRRQALLITFAVAIFLLTLLLVLSIVPATLAASCADNAEWKPGSGSTAMCDSSQAYFVTSIPDCDTRTFTISLVVRNAKKYRLIDGVATLTLPANVSLAEGETAEQQIDVISPHGEAIVRWSVVVDEGATGVLAYTATVSFASHAADVTAAGSIDWDRCAPDGEQPLPPVANDDEASTTIGVPVNIDAAANDTDPDGVLDLASAKVVETAANGDVTANGDGTFTYAPLGDFSGEDMFTYEICDNDGLCDQAKVTVIVSEPEEPVPPVANDDSAETTVNTPVTINVVANDFDPNMNLDPTTTAVTVDPANGQVINNGDGTFDYTPDNGYDGVDSFGYQVCDTDGLCDSATVTVTIESEGPEEPPIPIWLIAVLCLILLLVVILAAIILRRQRRPDNGRAYQGEPR